MTRLCDLRHDMAAAVDVPFLVTAVAPHQAAFWCETLTDAAAVRDAVDRLVYKWSVLLMVEVHVVEGAA